MKRSSRLISSPHQDAAAVASVTGIGTPDRTLVDDLVVRMKHSFLEENPRFVDDLHFQGLSALEVGHFKPDEVLDIRIGFGEAVLFRVEHVTEGTLGQVILTGRLLRDSGAKPSPVHEIMIWTSRHAAFVRANTGAYRESSGTESLSVESALSS